MFDHLDGFRPKIDACVMKPTRRALPPVSKKVMKPDSYKTVMCQAWLEKRECLFGKNCRFAHGEEELRPWDLPIKDPKYKTKLCEKYTMIGLCPYGDRCLFIHPKTPFGDNYINPLRAAVTKIGRSETIIDCNNTSLQGASGNFNIMINPNKVTKDLPCKDETKTTLNRKPPVSWPIEPLKFYEEKNESRENVSRNTEDGLSNDLSLSFGLSREGVFSFDKIENKSMICRQSTPVSTASFKKFSMFDNSDSGLGSDISKSPEKFDPFTYAIVTDNWARTLASSFF